MAEKKETTSLHHNQEENKNKKFNNSETNFYQGTPKNQYRTK
jgi:hypothetical protein